MDIKAPWAAVPSDVRIHDQQRREQAYLEGLCWFCGKRCGPPWLFIAGENAIQYRMFVDPPLHEECAGFIAARRSEIPYLERLEADEVDDPDKFKQAARPARLSYFRTKDYKTVKMNGVLYLQPAASRDVTPLDPDAKDNEEYELEYE